MHSTITKHCYNHRIPDSVNTAFFVFYPFGLNIAGMNSHSISTHDIHYGLPSSRHFFLTTWAVKANNLFHSVQSIPNHSLPERRRSIKYVAIFLAHCGRQAYNWTNKIEEPESEANCILITELLDVCQTIPNLSCILLLGCKTAVPQLPSIRIPIIATWADLPYNHLVAFYQLFMDNYADISDTKWDNKRRAEEAMHASYNIIVNANKIHCYF